MDSMRHGKSSRKSQFFKAVILLSLALAPVIASPPAIYAQLEDLVARIKPATVLIEVRDVLGNLGHGSGFVYGPSGYILTNHHVIEGKVEISVRLPGGRSFPASVIDYLRREEYSATGLQSDIDVAVLKISAEKLPTLLLGGGSENLGQGQDLLVFGYPGGVGTDQVSVTRGIVSSVRAGWIQTAAAIEPGNSGGPVVDRQGHVVGVATFVISPLRETGGVVAVSSVRDFATSALDTNGLRRKEVAVPGLEYISPIVFPKRETYRGSYSPGISRQTPYIREFNVDIGEVQNINGAYTYIAHDSRGSDSKYYVDTDGVFKINYQEANWSYSYPTLLLLFPLPPRVGRSWEGDFSGENSSLGLRFTSAGELSVDSAGEVVTTPAGTFSHSIKIVVQNQRTLTIGPQSHLYHEITTIWYAPNTGLIKSELEAVETKERFVEELLSMQ